MTTHDEVEKVTTELDELGASWAHVHHRVLAREAAALIRRLRDERDEARNKALDEAAERAGRLLGYYDGKAVTAAILALKSQEVK